MKIIRNSLHALLVILVASVCSYAVAQETFQSAEMIEFGTGIPVVGGGVPHRSDDSITARLSTSGLQKNASYTVWWVVFNEPSNCIVPLGCGAPDLFLNGATPPLNTAQVDLAEISVFFATGFMTGNDGVANITAHLNAGALPAGLAVNFGWMGMSGLKAGNGHNAEVHIVIRSHGESEPSFWFDPAVGVATSTFNGECEFNFCFDDQAIIFSPL